MQHFYSRWLANYALRIIKHIGSGTKASWDVIVFELLFVYHSPKGQFTKVSWMNGIDMLMQRVEWSRRQLSTRPRNSAFTFLNTDTGYATGTTTDISRRRRHRFDHVCCDNTKPVQRLVFIKLAPTKLLSYRILFKFITHYITQKSPRNAAIRRRNLEELQNVRNLFWRAYKNARCHAVQGQRFLELHIGFFLFVACAFAGAAGSRAAKPVWTRTPFHPWDSAYYTFSFYNPTFNGISGN